MHFFPFLQAFTTLLTTDLPFHTRSTSSLAAVDSCQHTHKSRRSGNRPSCGDPLWVKTLASNALCFSPAFFHQPKFLMRDQTLQLGLVDRRCLPSLIA